MENTSKKTRLATFLFAFFIGILGIHRFYVGKVATGIAMLLISLTGLGLIITSIWTFIDVIVILSGEFKDDKGLLIKKWVN